MMTRRCASWHCSTRNEARLAAAQAHGLARLSAWDAHHGLRRAEGRAYGPSVCLWSPPWENRQRLLAKRAAGLAKALVMSAALASNTLVDEAAVIRCHCLAQGRRKCSDLAEVFPQECQGVRGAPSRLRPDEPTRQAQLSPAARLAYHQAHRRPLLDELQRWLGALTEERLGEPNSALGKAYALGRSTGPRCRAVSRARHASGQSPGGASLEAVYSTAQKRPVLQKA